MDSNTSTKRKNSRSTRTHWLDVGIAKKYEVVAEDAIKHASVKSAIAIHLENHCSQVQYGIDASQSGHQQAEAAYGELHAKTESCYSDLSHTRKAYEKASFIQSQLQGNSSPAWQTHRLRVWKQGTGSCAKNQELSESKQSQPSSSYEVVPGKNCTCQGRLLKSWKLRLPRRHSSEKECARTSPTFQTWSSKWQDTSTNV